jgi:hypothetical protein
MIGVHTSMDMKHREFLSHFAEVRRARNESHHLSFNILLGQDSTSVHSVEFQKREKLRMSGLFRSLSLPSIV